MYRARYDMDPRNAVVRFIDANGEVTTMGYLVLPGYYGTRNYYANKAARAAIATLMAG